MMITSAGQTPASGITPCRRYVTVRRIQGDGIRGQLRGACDPVQTRRSCYT